VSVIQAILRHKSPNTTAIYLRSLGLEETRGALDALADRFQTVSQGQGVGSAKVTPFPRKSVVIRRKAVAGLCEERAAKSRTGNKPYASKVGGGKQTVSATVSTTKKGHAI
jgi:hypothetical protein